MTTNNVTVIEPRTEQPPKLPTILAGGAVRPIVPQDFDSAWRIANAVCKASMAPKGLETPEKAMVAIMHGLEVGLTPMNALQSIAVVNGRPTIWGDGAIGLARGSGLLEWMEEKFEGEEGKDGFRAVCIVKRRGEPKPARTEFSVADARKAALWNKAGPWQQYPKRMLQMRARAFALRDGFADVLKGLWIKEEVEDYPIKDITPAWPATDEPPAPPPAPAIEIPKAQVVEAPPPETKKIIVPDPATDLVGYVNWLDGKLGEFEDGEIANTYWNDHIVPVIDGLFPPDQEECVGVWRKHEPRWGG